MTIKDTDSIQLGYPEYVKQAGRLSGLRINLPAAPSRFPSDKNAAFVPLHSNGWFAMDSHHLSF
jgi:hypothetical protein